MNSPLLADVDAVTFDAGYTLLQPARPVADVYFEKARQQEPTLDAQAFGQRMKSLWARLHADYRSRYPDWESSDELERSAWRDFTRDLAKPFPLLSQAHEAWLADLVAHFDAPTAWVLTPGSQDVLHQLTARGFRIAIVSNWHSALRSLVEGLGLGSACQLILTSSDVGRKKPHPRLFEEASRLLDIPLRRIVHVGDSWEEDVLGAVDAGARAIHFCPKGDCLPSQPSVPRIASLGELVA
jgi:putative hydrolase of the HAD superfamily